MKKNSPLYVVGFMVLISALFGAGISVVHYVTLEKLETNARLYRNRTVAKAFSVQVQQPTALGYETAIEQQLTKLEFAQGNRVWEVYIRKTPPMDIGFVFSGMGFWDEIRGVLVLSPNLNEISSIEFLDQKETPGLGARIEEQWFKGQFNGYTIDWDQPIQDRIVFGQQNNGKAIDAITGATQTTMALERILNTELAEFRTIYQQKNLGQSTRN